MLFPVFVLQGDKLTASKNELKCSRHDAQILISNLKVEAEQQVANLQRVLETAQNELNSTCNKLALKSAQLDALAVSYDATQAQIDNLVSRLDQSTDDLQEARQVLQKKESDLECQQSSVRTGHQAISVPLREVSNGSPLSKITIAGPKPILLSHTGLSRTVKVRRLHANFTKF